jgi:methyl-accepting chemotaxis protein
MRIPYIISKYFRNNRYKEPSERQKLSWFKRLSFIQKQIFTCNFISIALISIFTIHTIHNLSARSLTDLEAKIDITEKLLVSLSGTLLSAKDVTALKSLADVARTNGAISHVTFFDQSGQALTEKMTNTAEYPIFTRSVDVKSPSNEKMGSFELVYNKLESDHEFATAIYRTLFEDFLFIGILNLGLFLVFGALSNPIIKGLSVLRSAARSSRSNGDNVRSAATQLSSSTSSQATAIRECSSTLDEITTMANSMVENVLQSAVRAKDCLTQANEGRNAANEVVQAVGEIDSSNRQMLEKLGQSNDRLTEISQIIQTITEQTKVINDIVFQTRLLSFNASVEAARAGENGRGFAVVAEEVGNLAVMSGKAAKDIEELLQKSVSKVGEIVHENKEVAATSAELTKRKIDAGVNIAVHCKEVFNGVAKNVEEVVKLMNDVTHASEEQKLGIRNMSSAMNVIDKAVQENALTAANSAQYSDYLASDADQLNTTVQNLNVVLLGTKSSRSKVTVFTTVNPPLIFVKDGIPAGIAGKLLEIAQRECDIELETIQLPWARAQEEMAKNPNSIFVATGRNQFTEAKFKWFSKIYTDDVNVFTRAENRLSSMEEIPAKIRRIATRVGSPFIAYANSLNLPIQEVAEWVQGVRMVKAGATDGMVLTTLIGEENFFKIEKLDHTEINRFKIGEIGWYVVHNAEQLSPEMKKLEKALAKARETDEYKTLLKSKGVRL